MASEETCAHCGYPRSLHDPDGELCPYDGQTRPYPYFRSGKTREELAEQVRRLREVMEVIAAPLYINGDDHAAAVKHARAVLAATETEKP